MTATVGNSLGLQGEHAVREYTDLIHLEGARALATYTGSAWAGRPALTVHTWGAGKVFYLAARPAADVFHDALVGALVRDLGLERCLAADLPEGVTAQKRSGGGRTFIFLHNLKNLDQAVDLGAAHYRDILDGSALTGRVVLRAFASFVLERVS